MSSNNSKEFTNEDDALLMHHRLHCSLQVPNGEIMMIGESWSCQTFGRFSVVGQGEPSIVVSVFLIIARVHGTHQGGSRRQLQPPITSYHGHAQASCPLFSFLESLAKLLAYFLLWDKEGQPLLWQCLRMLLGSMEHTRKASGVMWSRPSHQTSAMPRPVAPFFPSWRVLPNSWHLFCCGRRLVFILGEPRAY